MNEAERFSPVFINKAWVIYDSKLNNFYRKNSHVWVYKHHGKASSQARRLNRQFGEKQNG